MPSTRRSPVVTSDSGRLDLLRCWRCRDFRICENPCFLKQFKGAAETRLGGYGSAVISPRRSIKIGEEFVAALGVSAAPGGEKDEACAHAALDKVSAQLK